MTQVKDIIPNSTRVDSICPQTKRTDVTPSLQWYSTYLGTENRVLCSAILNSNTQICHKYKWPATLLIWIELNLEDNKWYIYIYIYIYTTGDAKTWPTSGPKSNLCLQMGWPCWSNSGRKSNLCLPITWQLSLSAYAKSYLWLHMAWQYWPHRSNSCLHMSWEMISSYWLSIHL